MNTSNSLKDGNILTFKVLQNVTTYQVRVALCPKGLWVCIEQSSSHWKATISEEIITQTITKTSASKYTLTLKEFTQALIAGLKKSNNKWSVGIMTPIELQLLRGSNTSKNTNNTKLYLILSDLEHKIHFPFTLQLSNMAEKEKLIEAIKKMKSQLEELRVNNDKSQTSFSILSETNLTHEQIKIENQQLKKMIKMYEDSLTQKRGAVEIDMILKEKNNLELLAETKKRQETKEINRLKGIHQILQREVQEVRVEVEHITKELALLQDSVTNPAKLKNHALRVLKNYEIELRNSKKIVIKQVKQIDNLKRNINNTKNTQKKLLTKIKQIQTQIEDAKKKANIKEISNRLSQGKGPSSFGSSSKAPSIASKSDKDSNGSKNQNRINTNNIVRQNLLKRTTDPPNNQRERTSLLKTSPMIHSPANSNRKIDTNTNRAVVSSHQVPKSNKNYQPRGTSVRSDSGNSSQQKKKEITPADKERQRLAIERLSGVKKPSIEAKVNHSTKNLIKKDEGKSLNKGVYTRNKPDSKDIFNKMKEIKAQYNNKSQNNKSNALANKIAELTSKK